jgi:acid phosphatase (class A)
MRVLAGLLVVFLCSFPAQADDEGHALLSASELDGARFLPPPPAAGSPQAAAEIAELKAIAARRTPAEFEAAAHDDKDESGAFFAAAIGPGFDLGKLPATKKLLADVLATEDVVSKGAKTHFARPRPWIVIADWQTCAPHKAGPALNSYPSGHATVAYSEGVVLAALLPDKAEAILNRAATFAENRLVCGVHFRSDIVAGQVLGTMLAAKLMGNPAFKSEYDAAAAELAAAHLR